MYKTAEVDIELSDFDEELIDKIFQLRRLGKPYERELDEYLYIRTGRAI